MFRKKKFHNHLLIIWKIMLVKMEKMAAIGMAAVAMLLIMAVVRRSWKRRREKRTKELPPGSLGWPLLGEMLEFISSVCSPNPENFMDTRVLKYGKVFKSHIFGRPTIVSADAEVNRSVLQSDTRIFVPFYPKSLNELLGKSSILSMEGSLHRKVHGVISSFFKSPWLKQQITRDMQNYLLTSMEGWQDRQLIYLQDEAKHVVFQILMKALMGLEPGKELQFLKQQFQEFIAGLMSVPAKLPGSRLYKSLQAKKRMTRFIMKIVEERRTNNNSSTTSNPKDVIDVLLNDASGQLTDDHISDNIIDLMIPAQDSVPVLITLATKYLSSSPLALQILQEENEQLKRHKVLMGEELCWTDYMSLSFTQDVITETLRMGNIIVSIMRKATRDIEIKGHFIPKGWCIFLSLRSVHLNEKLYDDPYSFKPWRWKDKEKDLATCSFTPFGGGQRLCPGSELARLEASIFLHHLVTNFSWVAEEDEIVSFPTVRMKRRMPIRVVKKTSSPP